MNNIKKGVKLCNKLLKTNYTKIKGENNYAAKVTNVQAKRIQLLRRNGLLYREIAKLYDLKYSTAVSIAKKGYKSTS